jgi:hypothetical protein
MHVPINVKFPHNISECQMGFNSAFKGLTVLYYTLCSSQSKYCSCNCTVHGIVVGWFGISTRWKNVVRYVLWSLYPGGWIGHQDGEKIS